MRHEGLIQTLLLGGVSLIDNPYRLGSDKWGEFVREARDLYQAGKIVDLDEDSYHLLESEAGVLCEFDGRQIMLEVPEPNWDNPGWSIVYVRENGKIKQINFKL